MAHQPGPRSPSNDNAIEHQVTLVDDSLTAELKQAQTSVDGSATQYENGRLRLIPAPSEHADDPLNFPTWRKVASIASICLFGGAALSTQNIVGGMLPIFMFVYAGLDPMLLNDPGGFAKVLATLPAGTPMTNPLEALGQIPGAQPLSRVNLLYSIPMLIVGLSNYFIVPASVAFGRRALIIFCAVLATVCTVWAGYSTSLESHLLARCLHAVGTGATESLIPLMIQDMTFIHQRNRAISIISAAGGVLTLALGVPSTYMVARMGWRSLYFACAILNGFSLLMILLFTRETRWRRTPAELRGEGPTEPIDLSSQPGATFQQRFGLFNNGGIMLKEGWTALVEISATFALPIVAYMIVFNAIFLGIGTGAALTTTSVLLAPPYNWAFDKLGLIVIAGFIASIFVILIGGFSDWTVERLIKRNGGLREAEFNLWNMFFPVFLSVLGLLLMGVGGEYVYRVHWMTIVTGGTMLGIGSLVAGIVATVVVIESYPRIAGPVLVNVASFRNLVAFGFLYGAPQWVALRGYMGVFSIFAGVIVLITLPLPLFLIYGKRLRLSSRYVYKVASTSL